MSAAKHQETVTSVWGLRCPHCGSDEQISIALTSWAMLHTDGTEVYGDHDWHERSPTQCRACDSFGTVNSFTIEEEPS